MLARSMQVCAFAIAFIATSTALAGPIATIRKTEAASTEYDFNEVYGSISFQLGTPFRRTPSGARVNYQKADLAALEALKSLAGTLNSLFGRSKGSYILTLTVTNATTGKEIAKAPILAVSSDVKQTLFFEKSRDEMFSLIQEQTLRDYIPIDDTNNKYVVKLEAVSSESLSLDLGILRTIVQTQAQIAGLANLPVSSSADVVIGSFEGLLKAIFDSEKKTVSQNALEMAFIKRDAPDRAKTAEADIETNFVYDRKNHNVHLPIVIKLAVQPTRLSARLGPDGKFEPGIPVSIVELTKLVAGVPDSTTLIEGLRTSKDVKVRAFLDDITEKEKIVGRNAALGCKDFYSSLSHYLTQRDQAAYYYAFIRLHQIELKASDNGEGCLQEPMRSDLDKWLKLPLGGLEIVSTSFPAVDVVAVGSAGSILNPADALEEAVSLELPEPIVGTPGLVADEVAPGTLPLLAVGPEEQ